MSNPYREIFRARGAKAFSAAAFVARLPLSMVTLGIVTMLSQTHGAYGIAGAVAATFALANALIAPLVSRLIDLRGQGRVTPPATVVTVLGIAGLALATRLGAPDWTLFASAILAGFMPSMTALVRARWTELYRDTPALHTAFAFESVVDEVIFMVGPVLAIGLSVAVFPEAGPLAAGILLATGVALFVAQKSTEPPVHAPEPRGGTSVLRLGSMQIIMLTLGAMGAIFGTAEVAAVAFAEERGQKAAASLVLAAYAAGSLVVGLVFGALKPAMPLQRQFLLAIALAAVTTLPLPIVGSVPALAAAHFLAGAAISPTFITAIGLIERHVPPSKLTESITWAMTGVGIGMALGASASGYVIDAFGASNGFWVSVAAGAAALATALAGYGWLRGGARASPGAATLAGPARGG